MANQNDGQIRVDDAGVLQMLANLKAAADNMRPCLESIGQLIHASIEQNFQEEGRYSSPGSWEGGTKTWDKLAQSTIKERKRHGHWPGKILQISSAGLANSISVVVGDDDVSVGTNKAYAAIHQFGGDIQRPPRKGQVKLRTTRRGGDTLKRQTGHKNLAVFAGDRHTAYKTIAVDIGGHTIHIPARPYLVVQQSDITEIEKVIAQHIADSTQ